MNDSITKWTTIVTLFVALGGPPLLRIVSSRLLSDASGVAGMLLFDLVLWAMLAAVLTVIFRVEKQTFASIGLRTPTVSTLVWGLLLVLSVNFMLGPATMWLVNKLGFPGYEGGLAQLLKLPIWYRVFLAVSAGIVEEIFYRGYAVERLASLTGNYWLAGLIAAAAFGLAHAPGWGLGPALVFLVDGAAATLFYIWKRDLSALIIAHVIGDTVGLVLLPPMSPGR